MRLVHKFTYKGKECERITEYCKISKNLHNQALYAIKQGLKDDKYIFYNELDSLMKCTTNLEGEVNYYLMPKVQCSQQCLKVLDKAMKSYFKSVKDWKVHKEKYNGKPKLPRYKKNLNQLVMTSQCCQIRDGKLIMTRDVSIPIPQWDKYGVDLMSFKQIRVNPIFDGKAYDIEIVYERKTVNADLDMDSYASIDLGVDNLVTMVSDKGRPLIYSGKQIKSLNQWFNKELARLKSELALKQGRRTSDGIRRLYMKRNDRLGDVMHKVSRHIVNYCLDNGIGNIVVGYNKGWKDSICIGKRNNQTFVSIPYDRLLSCLKYKCALCGINVIENEESYTSKCDGLAYEEVCKHDEYMGRRVKRGLYRSSVGKVINADVNGALNILRKVVGDSDCIRRIIDSGRLFRPIKQRNLFCLMNIIE